MNPLLITLKNVSILWIGILLLIMLKELLEHFQIMGNGRDEIFLLINIIWGIYIITKHITELTKI